MAEEDYKKWLEGISKKTGVRYDPDDPLYNYRSAYQARIEPTWQPEHKQYRWPDTFKNPEYDKFIDHETGRRKKAMLWEDEEKSRDVANITKQIIPPVGARTYYRPGQEGFAEKDLTQPSWAPAGPEPERRGGILGAGGATGAPSQPLAINGKQYFMPSTAISEALMPGQGGGGATQAPKYGIPQEMLSRFDDVVKAITGPSQESELLRMQAQGFGLGLPPRRIPGGGMAPSPQMEASKALAQIEGMKRSAASHIANSLANLMMDPNKFAAETFKTQAGLETDRERNRLLGRRAAVEEAELPLKARKIEKEAPATAAGVGPGGEKTLFGWNPEKQTWDVMSKGAVPVEVSRGARLVDPSSGRVLGTGEEGSGRLMEDLSKQAYKEYYKELQAIENDQSLQGPAKEKQEQKTKRVRDAQNRLRSTMERFGYGDLFESETEAPTRKPNETIEEYFERTGLR